MSRAFFYYQQKIDPSWYQAEPPPVVPDLSWIQSSGVRLRELKTVEQNQFVLPTQLDGEIKWFVKSGEYLPQQVSVDSSETDVSFFILSSVPDLSWLKEKGLYLSPSRVFQSSWVSPETFLAIAPPPDLSWLQSGGDFRRLKTINESFRTDNGSFLTPPLPSFVFQIISY